MSFCVLSPKIILPDLPSLQSQLVFGYEHYNQEH